MANKLPRMTSFYEAEKTDSGGYIFTTLRVSLGITTRFSDLALTYEKDRWSLEEVKNKVEKSSRPMCTTVFDLAGRVYQVVWEGGHPNPALLDSRREGSLGRYHGKLRWVDEVLESNWKEWTKRSAES
jgi:hypothetical protein